MQDLQACQAGRQTSWPTCKALLLALWPFGRLEILLVIECTPSTQESQMQASTVYRKARLPLRGQVRSQPLHLDRHLNE